MRSVRARTRQSSLGFEQLEHRLPLSATQASFTPASVHLEPAKKHPVATYPTGLSPAEARSYYGFDQVDFGGVAADGAGQTIAIVVARNNPKIVNDLAVFDQTFGLPDPPSFRVVNQTGGTKLPKNNKSWGSEAALDVQWAHAIAPGANILLVEAKSDSMANFIMAIDYARHAPGVTVVSVSASADEWNSEAVLDSLFTTPPGHPGVTFVFATGDDGGTAEYPSSSPNVLSVGGTTLYPTSSAQWYDEIVWSYGGGGASKYEGVPSYQDGLGLTSRGTPDVSYNADPYTGFSVYDSYGSRGWAQFGGTSAGTPQWAALVAIVNQGRSLAGKAPLANAQAALYAMPSADFHDIVYGDNQVNSAGTGYDLATGVGSPIADRLIPDMVAFSGSTDFTVGPAPVIPSGKKSKHHFATGVDVASTFATSVSLSPGGAGLHPLMASSVEAVYSQENALTLLNVAPEAVSHVIATRASSRSRLGSAARAQKAADTSDNSAARLDAFFDGLGEGVAAA